MSDELSGVLINIVAIVVFSNMAYMIMPESNLKKFMKLILGLIVMISIMTPIINLLMGQDVSALLNIN